MGDKEFKILSIDGGRIKGLYSASILKKFEKTFNCTTSDHFDMICGTSTDGLKLWLYLSKFLQMIKVFVRYSI